MSSIILTLTTAFLNYGLRRLSFNVSDNRILFVIHAMRFLIYLTVFLYNYYYVLYYYKKKHYLSLPITFKNISRYKLREDCEDAEQYYSGAQNFYNRMYTTLLVHNKKYFRKHRDKLHEKVKFYTHAVIIMREEGYNAYLKTKAKHL